jgi:ribonuclease D
MGLEMPHEGHPVDTGLSVAEISALARSSGSIALDTEFMGEGRYRTLLCLIQVAVCSQTDGLRVELIDPLADGVDFAPLAEVLADPAIEVVLHAGRQDIALIRRRLETEVRGVFDTQVAAGFAGMAAQSSYDSLLGEMLGVRLAKSASFTRWDRRPLSAEQLAYAREDVVHLLELAGELKSRLESSGRLQWALQECEILERSSDERDTATIFGKLPRIRGLSATSQGVARELVEWRESTAAEQDRTVQSVLADAALVEIAKRKPSSIQQLESIRGVGQGALRRRAQPILDAVKRGAERPVETLEPLQRPAAPDASDAPLIALSEALVRARAQEAGLAYELIAGRADLQSIVVQYRMQGTEPNVRTLSGWRRELVGGELLDLLDGRVSLSVKNSKLQIGS